MTAPKKPSARTRSDRARSTAAATRCQPLLRERRTPAR